MEQTEPIWFIRCIEKGCNVIYVEFLTKLLNLNAIMRKNWTNQIDYHP